MCASEICVLSIHDNNDGVDVNDERVFVRALACSLCVCVCVCARACACVRVCACGPARVFITMVKIVTVHFCFQKNILCIYANKQIF